MGFDINKLQKVFADRDKRNTGGGSMFRPYPQDEEENGYGKMDVSAMFADDGDEETVTEDTEMRNPVRRAPSKPEDVEFTDSRVTDEEPVLDSESVQFKQNGKGFERDFTKGDWSKLQIELPDDTEVSATTDFGKINPTNEMPTLAEPTFDEQISMRERDAARLNNEPVKKQKLWKDALYKMAVIGSNIYQGMKPGGGTQLPVTGWGRAQRNQQIGENNQALGQLYGVRKQRNEQQDYQTNQRYNQARTENMQTDNNYRQEQSNLRDDQNFYTDISKYGYNPQNLTPFQKDYIARRKIDPNSIGEIASANAKTIKVGDAVLERNPRTGVFEEAKGVSVETGKKLFTATYPDGRTESYWLSEGQRANMETRLAQVNATLSAANMNSENGIAFENDRNQRVWENEIAKNEGVVRQNTPIIEENNKQIKQLEDIITNQSGWLADVKNTKDAQDKIDSLKRKNAELQGEINKGSAEATRLKNNPPQKRTYTATQTISGETANTAGNTTNSGGQIYSGKVFQSPSAIRAEFPNKTDDQIRQLVTNGGGRFIE